jgi:LysR family glycine cleavage system transcriptional activator
MEAPPNLKRAPYDLCLFYSADTGGWICEDVIFPVCAPALAARLSAVEDLRDVPCLSDTTWAQDWAVWLSAASPGTVLVPSGPIFSLYALAVEETVNGAGVLIGHEALVAAHLAQGRLVAPFAQRAHLERGLRIWSARPIRPASSVGKVAAWLRRG